MLHQPARGEHREPPTMRRHSSSHRRTSNGPQKPGLASKDSELPMQGERNRSCQWHNLQELKKFRGRDLEWTGQASWIWWDTVGSGSTGRNSGRQCQKAQAFLLTSNCKAIFLIFQAKLYLNHKGPEVRHGFYVSLLGCIAGDHSPGPLELVTNQEGTEADWFLRLRLHRVRWRAH